MQKDKPNIGIVVDNDFNNDIRVRKEARILLENGYNVFVLCFGYDDKKYDSVNNIKIERITIKKEYKDVLFGLLNTFPIYDYIWKNNIYRFIMKFNIHVIHTHDLYMAKPAYTGILKSKKQIPLILDLHENFPEAIKSYNWTKGFFRNLLVQPSKWKKKEKEYLNLASKIIVLSNHFKRTLLRKYSFLTENNIIVYPNVIDFKRFDTFSIDKSIKRKDGLTLLYFGGVAERRGIFETINVVKKIIEKGYRIYLLIIGPVDKVDRKRFYSEINETSIKDHIEYIPWIDVSKLPTYLSISDICLAPFHKNPQHESGIANKLFQYMYGGKPIIASDCAPQKELIESNNCGLIFSDIDQYINHIISLINNKKLRLEMGQNAKKALFSVFKPKIIDKKLIIIYQNIA